MLSVAKSRKRSDSGHDPLVGRFLSPDHTIQDPGNTQNYNRYTYCLNNPLKYNDPSGWLLIPGSGGFTYSPTNMVDFGGHTAQELSDGNGGLVGGGGWGGNGGALPGGGSNVGGQSGYFYSCGNYYDRKTGNMVSFDEVYNNYIVPRFASKEETIAFFNDAIFKGADYVKGDAIINVNGKVDNYGGVKGLTVNYYYGFHDNYTGGVIISLAYTGSMANGAQWKQRIYTDTPTDGNTSPYWDGNTGTEYYYFDSEMKDHTKGNTVSFSDTPNRGQQNASWRGILSLFNGDNLVLSLYYGFRVNNYVTTPYPILVLYP